MKIPNPKKLPSGSWRIQLMVNGKRYSITDKDPKQCKQRAKEIYAGIEYEDKIPITTKIAFKKYIDLKEAVLSPSTILAYRRYSDNYLQAIMQIKICDLTQEQIQKAVNIDYKNGKSPKTIRNAHGLLSAVLKEYRPKFVLRTRLPQKKKYEVRIPTENEMQKIWATAQGTKYELPILLASWLGLRMSEIRGLKFEDIVDSKIHIQRAIVRKSGGSIEKNTKSISGDRWITCPSTILNLIYSQKGKDGYICNYSDNAIYKNFISICKLAEIKPCRFHDLRHFAASEAHSLGIPDKYAMQRMGHKTDNMLKTVYQHTMKDKEEIFANIIDEKMKKIYDGI